MIKEKAINRLPLTIGIVNILSANHVFAQAKSIFEHLLKFSPLLKLTTQQDPDIVLVLEECNGEIHVSIKKKVMDDPLISARVELKNNSYKLPEIYVALYGMLTTFEPEFNQLAEDKWLAEHNATIAYSFEVINAVKRSSSVYMAAQGYALAVQDYLPKTHGATQGKCQITIQEKADNPGNIELRMQCDLPVDHYFLVKFTLPDFTAIFRFSNHVEEGKYSLMIAKNLPLTSLNLHHKSLVGITSQLQSPNDWKIFFISRFHDDWTKSIGEVQGARIIKTTENDDDAVLPLFAVPKEGLLQLRLVETVVDKKTALACSYAISEIFKSTNNPHEDAIEVVIEYGEEVKLEMLFQKMCIAKLTVQPRILSTHYDDEVIDNIKNQTLNQVVIPLSIFKLAPQASA